MSIFLILLLIFLFYLLRPAFKVWQTMNRLRREARSAFEQGASSYRRSGDTGNYRSRRRQESAPCHRKLFSRDMGEYVAFDEISEERSSTSPDGDKKTTVVTESQVTDVEWEDLPPKE